MSMDPGDFRLGAAGVSVSNGTHNDYLPDTTGFTGIDPTDPYSGPHGRPRSGGGPGSAWPDERVAQASGEQAERELVAAVRREVADRLTSRTDDAQDGFEDGTGIGRTGLTGGREAGWALIGEVLDRRAREAMRTGGVVLSPDAEERIARTVFDALFGLGGFSPLLADESIENIDANGCDVVWVRYADGTRAQVGPVADSDAELVDLIRILAARSGAEERRFDRGVPSLSVPLPDGSRLFAVMAVSRRPSVSIRRHRYPRTTLEELRRLGTVDAGLADFFTAAVLARKNILVAGGTNTGKTTLLRGLASAIPAEERLVTIEDAFELGLDRDGVHPNVVAMQAREPNIEGAGEVTQSDLVRWALRMSPDRVIVGEIRGAEVIPMANAMSQGNDGSMATIHASDSRGVFTRLASYAVQAPERLPLEATNLLIANAVDFIVHLSWSDGVRVVSSIREVIDADGPMVVSNEIFRPDPTLRAVPGAALRPQTLDDLVDAGYDHILLHRAEGWWER
jgi:pilus assembly protein CpaF